MIKTITGDLIVLALDGEFDMIIHGANIYHIMGAGVAKQIKENFPQAYKADLLTTKGDKNKIGTYSYAICKTNKKILNMDSRLVFKYVTVANAYTQARLSNGEDDVFEYEGFEKILKNIFKTISYYKIGMPLIGCGLANGNRERILDIIEKTIGSMDVTIVEYQPTK